MFQDLLTSLLSNLIPATILFMVLILTLTSFVKRADVPLLASGLARLVVTVLGSPLMFLRKMIGQIIDEQRSEEYESLESEQFLIRRQLSALKAGIVVGSITILALGFAAAYGRLPSRELFTERREARAELAALPLRPAALAATLKKLEDEWPTIRPATRNRWLRQAEEQLLELRTSRLALEPQLPQALLKVLPEPGYPMPYGSYGEREERASQVYRSSRDSLEDEKADKYFQSLDQERQLAYQLGEIDAQRTQLQPTWSTTIESLRSYPQTLANAQQRVAAIKSSIAIARWGAMGILAITIGIFYVCAWLIGFLIECYSLVIAAAGDLRVLRCQTGISLANDVVASKAHALVDSGYRVPREPTQQPAASPGTVRRFAASLQASPAWASVRQWSLALLSRIRQWMSGFGNSRRDW